MDGSNADLAPHMEGNHADLAWHMKQRHSFRDQKIAKIGIWAKLFKSSNILGMIVVEKEEIFLCSGATLKLLTQSRY